jgi:hypothetical protein
MYSKETKEAIEKEIKEFEKTIIELLATFGSTVEKIVSLT